MTDVRPGSWHARMLFVEAGILVLAALPIAVLAHLLVWTFDDWPIFWPFFGGLIAMDYPLGPGGVEPAPWRVSLGFLAMVLPLAWPALQFFRIHVTRHPKSAANNLPPTIVEWAKQGRPRHSLASLLVTLVTVVAINLILPWH